MKKISAGRLGRRLAGLVATAALLAACGDSEPAEPAATEPAATEPAAPAAEAAPTSPPAALQTAAVDVQSPEPADPGFESVGRGRPVANLYDTPIVGAVRTLFGAPYPGEERGRDVSAAKDGAVPEGVEALPRDLFTSDDFYKDKDLWTDPRYFRCNSPTSLEELWTGGFGGEPAMIPVGGSPSVAPWGHCDRDFPREAIVSPYPFTTAQEHYEALLAETTARGGPTEHTYATIPGEWTGVYRHPGVTPSNESWYGMRRNQMPTILSLLTPKYQEYMVQAAYHEAHDNAAQWPSQYCWPEGFMRRWAPPATWEHYVIMTPDVVQIMAGVARNFLTEIYIGREFNMEGVAAGGAPRLGSDVPRWYGETIGFWDGDTLITWTSNIQGWMAHSAFEFSNKMQSIEIYAPNRDANGDFTGLNHETILYDEEALVQPVRIVRNLIKAADYNEGVPYPFIDCIQTIFPVDGKATPLSPGDTFSYEVPDMYGRPWADIWEKYYEQNMEKPEQEDLFSFE